MATVAEIRAESLSRAVGGRSCANYATIIQGFMDKGIPADQITPRENVFTYRAWQALGRQVRKGEHGVKVFTRVPIGEKRDRDTGELLRPAGTAARSTTVFHITQTDLVPGAVPMEAPTADALELVTA
jgi:antirestriction protein ArdC